MMVPGTVNEVNEANSPFHHSPRKQAVGPEGACLVGIETIHGQSFGRLLAEIEKFGGSRLHSKGHLVGRNSGCDFGIACRLLMNFIQVPQRVEPSSLARDAQTARIGQVQHRITGIAERYASISGGHESAAPKRTAGPFQAVPVVGDQHKIPRHVLAFASQTIVHPRTHARIAEQRSAAMHQKLCRVVVRLLAVHRANQTDFVGDGRGLWQQVRQFHAAVSVSAKRARTGLNGFQNSAGGTLFGDGQMSRNRLAIHLGHFGLGVEEIEM